MPTKDPDTLWSRRGFIRGALASLGLFGASSAFAKCVPAVRTDSGPFYPRSEIPRVNDLTRVDGKKGRAKGNRLYVFGTVTDADCKPVEGATVEIWQCDVNGNYWHPRAAQQDALDPHFRYFAHAVTGDDGRYMFKTIVPSPYGFAGIERAPHIHYKVKHPDHRDLVTELYFDREADATLREDDVVWKSRPSKTRHRLVVKRRPPKAYASYDVDFEDGSECCTFDLQLDKTKA